MRLLASPLLNSVQASSRRGPGSFVRPLGIANETSIAIAMEARTVAAVDLRDQLSAAVPSRTKLFFLAGVHTPPVDSYEQMPLL